MAELMAKIASVDHICLYEIMILKVVNIHTLFAIFEH
jgi:hypothetical protein